MPCFPVAYPVVRVLLILHVCTKNICFISKQVIVFFFSCFIFFVAGYFSDNDISGKNNYCLFADSKSNL